MFYYFKIIQAMFFKEAANKATDDGAIVSAQDITTAFKLLLIITAASIILLGLFPSLITEWLHY